MRTTVCSLQYCCVALSQAPLFVVTQHNAEPYCPCTGLLSVVLVPSAYRLHLEKPIRSGSLNEQIICVHINQPNKRKVHFVLKLVRVSVWSHWCCNISPSQSSGVVTLTWSVLTLQIKLQLLRSPGRPLSSDQCLRVAE